MLKEIRPALVMIVALTVLTGLVYPLTMTGISELLFPWQAKGELIEKDGKVVGSALIGQSFTADKYFHGRPSAITAPDPKDPTKTIATPYDASNSMGSNLGPTSKALVDGVKDAAEKLHAENPAKPVPVDLVTASGSGLDPDITPAAAEFQIPRVAKARELGENDVALLVARMTDGRALGIFGEPHVNVLKLNLALDEFALQKKK
jgi:potassium-transporting ATPase KdpC subunit